MSLDPYHGLVYDLFRMPDGLVRDVYAQVVGRTTGACAAVLAYRTFGPQSDRPPGVIAHPAIVLHRRGRRRVVLAQGGRTTESGARDRLVSLYPAGCEVHASYLEPCEGLLVAFDPGRLGDIARRLGVVPSFAPLVGLADEVLEGACETLWRNGSGSAAVSDALAAAIATRILERYAAPVPAVPAWLRRAEAHVNAHLSAPLSVDDLATAAGLSRAHFSRLFKRSTGFSPHDFILRRRVERAKELLRRDPGLALADVAAEVGFCDQSHLTARFREQTGVTPAAYRDGTPEVAHTDTSG